MSSWMLNFVHLCSLNSLQLIHCSVVGAYRLGHDQGQRRIFKGGGTASRTNFECTPYLRVQNPEFEPPIWGVYHHHHHVHLF